VHVVCQCVGVCVFGHSCVSSWTDRDTSSDGTSEASSPSLSSRVAVGPTTTRPQVLARHLCPAPTPTVQPCRVLSAADVLDVVGARSPSSGVACSGR